MRFRALLPLLVILAGLTWLTFDATPHSEQRFDRRQNATWLGHAWWTGRTVNEGRRVGEDELEALVQRLDAAGISTVYVHAGPIRPDGSIADPPGRTVAALRRRAPHIQVLPWLGGVLPAMDLEDPAWRAALVETVRGLEREGFDGVHLDLEPLPDRQPGYVELLAELRGALGQDFFLSHAARKAGPWGLAPGPLGALVWSEGWTRELAELTDETVLMAYDSALPSRWLYGAFVRHEVEQVAAWACARPDHALRIGVPSFDDSPTSDPEVERLEVALPAVRAALERRPAPCVKGVAVYAEWVTTPEEWATLERLWAAPPPRVAGR